MPAATAADDPAQPRQERPRELVFLTWPDYIDPALVAQFEAEQDARVRFEYFDSDDARDALLAQTDARGFDLIILDNTAVESYQRRGWIVAPDWARASHLRHIDPAVDQAYPGTQGLVVPYFWGTLGIAYRTDLVPRAPLSWMDLLRPSPEVAGKILMLADSYDLIGMPLKALGFSMNSADPAALAQAAALLAAQKPAVRRYGTLALNERSELVTGEVVAAMSYSGDAAMLMEHHDAIAYRVPEEGGALWVDYLAIGVHGDRALATALVDFLNRPEIAARNAQFVHYATPNRAAEALLPAAFRDDPLVYPGAAVLANSEHYQRLPPDAVRRRVQIFADIVHGH